MHTKLFPRRKLLIGAVAAFPAAALSSTAFASGAADPSSSKRGLSALPRTKQTGSVSVQVESLDPRIDLAQSVDLVSTSFDDVVSVRQSTRIPAPYYFAVDVNRNKPLREDWDFTISLYDDDGMDVGRITTSGGGTAIFRDQQLRFRIGRDAR